MKAALIQLYVKQYRKEGGKESPQPDEHAQGPGNPGVFAMSLLPAQWAGQYAAKPEPEVRLNSFFGTFGSGQTPEDSILVCTSIK